MKPAITLVQLNAAQKYAQAYADVLRSLHWGFTVLGYDCVSATAPQAGRVNIVFGWALGFEGVLDLPSDSIFYHLEQNGEFFSHDPLAPKIAERFRVWDFSKKSVHKWKEFNPKYEPYFAPVSYAPVLEDMPKCEQDIDVVYIGKFAGHRLRKLIQIAIGAERSVACLSGVWGALRGEFIARAKVLVNLSAQAAYCSVLETVRLQYLLANKKAVVCEKYPVNLEVPEAFSSVLLVREVKLQDTIEGLLNDPLGREAYAGRCYDSFTMHDVRDVIKKYF